MSHVDDSGTTHPLHVAHQYKDNTLCFDDRVNFVQTQFTPNVAFTMRTFRFNVAGSGDATAVQGQTIACSLHLDATSNISQDQAPVCDCHTQSDCQALAPFTGRMMAMALMDGYGMAAGSDTSRLINTETG